MEQHPFSHLKTTKEQNPPHSSHLQQQSLDAYGCAFLETKTVAQGRASVGFQGNRTSWCAGPPLPLWPQDGGSTSQRPLLLGCKCRNTQLRALVETDSAVLYGNLQTIPKAQKVLDWSQSFPQSSKG